MNNMIYNIRQPPVYTNQTQTLGNGCGPVPPEQDINTNMKENNGHMLVEKLIIGLDRVPPSYNLREQLTGVAGANMQYIRKETGVNITLRGIGSLFIDPATGTESQEPLHFFIEHQRLENLNSAKQLAKNLIETLQQEFLQFQQQQQSPALPQINIPPPSLISVPPPSVIQANVAPPSVPAAAPPPANIIHQQFVTQGGAPINMPQANMAIQQPQQQPTGNHNLSMPPPIKQIVQFHQPPPQAAGTTLNAQQPAPSPIILNHQPQASIQYQYIQQPARDAQGNPLTLQQVYHQSPQQIQGIQMQALPSLSQLQLQQQQQHQQQQQYITVQGNTAYMVPPPTIIQQTQGQPPQLSIIQHPPPLHMQLPPGAIAVQTNPIAEAMHQQLEQTQLRTEQASSTENDEYTIEKQDETDQLPVIDEDSGVAPVVETDASLVRALTSLPPPTQQQLMRQPPPPMKHVPPPAITMSVPPPMNGVQQHIVGNTLFTTTTTNQGASIHQFQQQVIPLQPQQHQQTQQYIHTAPNGQNYVMSTATAQWQARAPQPTQFVTQQISAGDLNTLPPPPISMGSIPVSGAPVQQTAPIAVTFSQPMMQQQLQLQFQPQMMHQVQMQAQPTTQQFNVYQTQPPPPQTFLQQNPQQQQHQMGLISVNQNSLAFTQANTNAPQSLMQQQQQQQQQKQHLQHQQQLQQQQQQQLQQRLAPPPAYGEQIMVRSGYKRKSTSEATDAPPPMQARLGVGQQRDLADFTQAPPPPPPSTSSSIITSTGGVGSGQGNGTEPTTTTTATMQLNQTTPTVHTPQSQKFTGHHPGYIGMMRYNSDVRGGGPQPPRPPYSSVPSAPRGRMMFSNNYNNIRPTTQHEANYRMGFGPSPYRSEGSGQGLSYGGRRMQR